MQNVPIAEKRSVNMSRRKNSSGLVCYVCGQDIEEHHEFKVKKRGEKGYHTLHGDCLALFKETRKKFAEKSK
jgi:hypothetical protein